MTCLHVGIALEKSVSNLDIDLLNVQHADWEEAIFKCNNSVKSDLK